MIRVGVILSLLDKVTNIGQEKLYRLLFDFFGVTYELDSSYVTKIKKGIKPVNKTVIDEVKQADLTTYTSYLNSQLENKISIEQQNDFLKYVLILLKEDNSAVQEICKYLKISQFNLFYCEIDFFRFLSGIIIISFKLKPDNKPVCEHDYEFDDKMFSDVQGHLLPSSFNLTTNQKIFESMFRKVDSIEFSKAQKTSRISLYSLNLDVDRFDILSFDSYIEKRLGEYVLSRIKLNDLIDSKRERAINTIASNYIKKSTSQRETLGFLLYEFLENDLQAPKIFNGIEIGTVDNDLTHCDGVYLLMTSDGFQLIFGTSDIQSSIFKALDKAFFYASELISNRDKSIRFINASILNKSFDSETANYLKEIIIPTPGTKIQTIPSIGIFVGYTFNFDKRNLDSLGYKEVFENQMKSDLMNLKPCIEELIEKHNLLGINCYLYVLPFNNAEEDEKYLRTVLRQENIYE